MNFTRFLFTLRIYCHVQSAVRMRVKYNTLYVVSILLVAVTGQCKELCLRTMVASLGAGADHNQFHPVLYTVPLHSHAKAIKGWSLLGYDTTETKNTVDYSYSS